MLSCVNVNATIAESLDRRRKRRTTIGLSAKDSLELHFQTQPKPSSSQIAYLAASLRLDKDLAARIRTWQRGQGPGSESAPGQGRGSEDKDLAASLRLDKDLVWQLSLIHI